MTDQQVAAALTRAWRSHCTVMLLPGSVEVYCDSTTLMWIRTSQRNAPFSHADRLRLGAQVGQRQAEQDVGRR